MSTRKNDGELFVRLRGEYVRIQIPRGKVTEAQRLLLKQAAKIGPKLLAAEKGSPYIQPKAKAI